ncbi:PREDICTED: uncharacterized protein LOC106123383 isoform X8 [Papilio xuthus]|uniref:Uncharacterized protein LOC106123383 isoform X8 n=1 Tax=Papilio xuthus TaxID=66420 RepID=A0AAJ6ZLH1_PAPXU|nr:PREDICTED: uncharacterized protein LOC106123383 isoform X8 [Papilio xuthus]
MERKRSRRASLSAGQRRRLAVLRSASMPLPLSSVSHIYHVVACPTLCCHKTMLRRKMRRLSAESADPSAYDLARSRRASLSAEQRRRLSLLRAASAPLPPDPAPVSHLYHSLPCPRLCCSQKYVVSTDRSGDIHVHVQGDLSQQDKRCVFLTVHDLGTNHTSLVDFVNCSAMAEIKERSCFIHVDVPGHEENSPDLPESCSISACVRQVPVPVSPDAWRGPGYGAGLSAGTIRSGAGRGRRRQRAGALRPGAPGAPVGARARQLHRIHLLGGRRVPQPLFALARRRHIALGGGLPNLPQVRTREFSARTPSLSLPANPRGGGARAHAGRVPVASARQSQPAQPQTVRARLHQPQGPGVARLPA